MMRSGVLTGGRGGEGGGAGEGGGGGGGGGGWRGGWGCVGGGEGEREQLLLGAGATVAPNLCLDIFSLMNIYLFIYLFKSIYIM